MADLRARIGARSLATPSQQLDASSATGASSRRRWPGRRRSTRGTGCASCSSRPGRGREAGGRFLRDYLEWTRRQTGLTGRVAEAVLDDASHRATPTEGRAEDDAVRILTVHGAKGLEFPITVVCGFNSRARRPAPRRAGGLRSRRRHAPPPAGLVSSSRGSTPPCHRRADGRVRAHPAALRRLHPGERPPRRLPPPRRPPIGYRRAAPGGLRHEPTRTEPQLAGVQAVCAGPHRRPATATGRRGAQPEPPSTDLDRWRSQRTA